MKKWNIDIVDDCEVILSILSFELCKRSTYNVRTFKSGDEYLKSNRDSDLLVLDHYLSSIHSATQTGVQVLSELQDNHAPVIYLSGQNEVRTAVKAMRKGASDYVSKESDDFVSILTTKIDEILNEVDQQEESKSVGLGVKLSGVNIFAAATVIAVLLLIICI
jgi:DNA-binding NtrC family response regulator